MEKKGIINLVFFLLGLLILCSLGSRGPFVCFILFSAVYLFFFKEYKHKLIIRTFILSLSVILTALSQFFAELMIILLSSIGMKTRIFDKMLEDAFVNYDSSSGRNELHEILIQKLNHEASGIGFGPFSDRKIIDGYAHNIIIELWVDFGYYIGSAILCMLLLLIVKFMVKTCDRDTKIFVFLLFSASIVKLMFSGSYLQDSNLFFMIGVCIYGLRQPNINRVLNN